MNEAVAHPMYDCAATAEGDVSMDEAMEESPRGRNRTFTSESKKEQQEDSTTSVISHVQKRERLKVILFPQLERKVSSVAVREIFSDLEKRGDAADAERKICTLLADWERMHAAEKAQIAQTTEYLNRALVDKQCLIQMVLELHRLMKKYGEKSGYAPSNSDDSDRVSKLQQEVERQSDEITSWINSQRSVMTINLKLKGMISDLKEELDSVNKMNTLLEHDIAGLGEKYNKLVVHCRTKLEEAEAAVVAAEEEAKHERLAAQAKTVKVASLITQLKAKEAENAELHSICDRLLMEGASIDDRTD